MNDDGFEFDPDPSNASPAEETLLPPRLRNQRGSEGELVRRFLRRSRGTPEDRAWRRLEAATLTDGARPRRRGVGWILAGASAAALVAGLWWVIPGAAPSTTVATETAIVGPSPSVAPPVPTTRPADSVAVPPPASASMARVVAIDANRRALAPGRWTWAGEASISVGPRSQASAVRRAGSGPTVTLVAGRAALEVVHKSRPAPFRLIAGPFTFTVLGTAFSVERGATEITLAVTQGRVAVSRDKRTLALITAGGFWTGTLEAAAPTVTAQTRAGTSTPGPAEFAPSAPAAAPSQVKPSAVSCGGRGAPGQTPATRLACWRAQVTGGGLRSEVALYNMGTIARDELGDQPQALAAFEELRRHYPDGTLRTEAELSIVGLLARTGRYADALAESARLLGQRVGNERAAELHVLRGNVYREGFGDLTRAADEYRLATNQLGRPATADEALFLHAVTLEAMGRHAEAVERYREYLTRVHPAHEKEARQRLLRLSLP